MSFNDEEIANVVSKLVPSDASRSYDALGVRRTDRPFTNIQQSALGVFVLYPLAPYYVIYLGTRRLLTSLASIGTQVSDILTLLRVLRRNPVGVGSLTSLRNAQVAIFEMESSGSADLGQTPAYARVQANLSKFLSSVGGSIRDGDVIVPTPAEARNQLPRALEQLKASLENLQRIVSFLGLAEEDAGTLRLQQRFVQSTLQRARGVLETRYQELQSLPPNQRLDSIRTTVLDLLGVKAAVTVAGTVPSVSSFLGVSGTGLPYADESHPAIPASLTVPLPGPYVLVNDGNPESSSNVLRVEADGGGLELIYLPESQIPRLDGMATAPYILDTTNNELSFLIDGVTAISAALTTGTRTAAEVCADINVALTSTNYKAVPFFSPLLFDGGPIEASGNTLTLPFGQFPHVAPYGLEPGATVNVYFGSSNVGQSRTIVTGPTGPDYNTIEVDGAPLVAATDLRIQVGVTTRIRLEPKDRFTAVSLRSTLQIKTPTTLQQRTGMTLGFYGEALARGVPTDVDIVAGFLATNMASFSASATSVVQRTCSVRSVPQSPFKVQLFLESVTQAYAAVTDIELPFTTAQPGDQVVLRTGPDAGKFGTVYQASPARAIFYGLTGGEGEFELVPAVFLGHQITVPSGPNQGTYFLEDTNPVQQQIRTPFIVTRDAGAAVVAPAQCVRQYLTLSSRNTTLASSIALTDSIEFFSPVQLLEARSTTRYLQLPVRVNDLEDGDFLEFFANDTAVPTFSTTIHKIEDRILSLEDAIDGTTPRVFGAVSPPYARLRKARSLNYQQLSNRLFLWLDAFDLTQASNEMNRTINPLLVNTNPSDSQVGAAEAVLRDIYGRLTITGAQAAGADITSALEDILTDYTVQPVAEVDVMLRSFRELGADRAIDVLLEGQFSAFFGFDQEDASYAGAMQKVVREVAINDAPVRKVDRTAALVSQLQSSTDDNEDYETSFDDRDERSVPTPTVGGGFKTS